MANNWTLQTLHQERAEEAERQRIKREAEQARRLQELENRRLQQLHAANTLLAPSGPLVDFIRQMDAQGFRKAAIPGPSSNTPAFQIREGCWHSTRRPAGYPLGFDLSKQREDSEPTNIAIKLLEAAGFKAEVVEGGGSGYPHTLFLVIEWD